MTTAPARTDSRDPPISGSLPPAASDAKQALRIRRFLMASASYVAGVALMGLAYAFGFVALPPALAIAGVALAVNAGLYLLFRARLNLRFKDPSLTWLQVVLATSTVMVSGLFFTRGL